MKKEENKKMLSSLKKISYSHKPIEILIKKVISFNKGDDESEEKLGLMGEFRIKDNNKRVTALFNPDGIIGPADFYSLKDLEGKTILSKIIFVKNHNCVYAKQVQQRRKSEPIILPKINRTKEQEMLKNIDSYIGKEFDGKIVSFNEYGALLVDDENVGYFLYDSRFAYGYIPIKSKKKVGDVLRVKIIENARNKQGLYVEMVEKYKEEVTIKPEEFEPDSVVRGVIVKKTSTLCFVNIAPMVDALCFPIEGYEVGTEVFVQIIDTKDLGNRKAVRGKIILTKFDDEFKL